MLQCYDFESDKEADEHECCGTCHGGNFFEEDVRLTFMLKDGRMAELCCGKIRKLVTAGLLNEKYLEKAH
jgi:hypothetical protein